MDFFCLNDSNCKELMYDMKGIRNAFYNNENEYSSNNELLGNIDKNNILRTINYFHKMEKKGNIYLTNSYAQVAENVLLYPDVGVKSVSLYFVKDGGCSLSVNKRTKKEMQIVPNSNNIFFMQEYCEEYYIYQKGGHYESQSLHLSIPYFENLVNLYPDLFSNVFLRYQKGEAFYLNDRFLRTNFELYTILEQIKNCNLIGNWNNAYVDAKVLELLSLIFKQEHCPINRYCGQFCKTCQDRDKIREAAYIMENNIDNPLTIRELALKVGINEKKLKYGFKEIFNNTVYGYLFDYKMKLAERLLRDTQEPISEIALQCGFEYPSHFSTAFKRRFGISPNKWRSE